MNLPYAKVALVCAATVRAAWIIVNRKPEKRVVVGAGGIIAEVSFHSMPPILSFSPWGRTTP
jgi:hypothetical protein